MPTRQPLWGMSHGEGENAQTVAVWSYHELARRLAKGYHITGGSRYQHRVNDANVALTCLDIEGFQLPRAIPQPFDGSK